MKGYPTTFLGLFDPPPDGRPRIDEIEIPIIQRDFAQGRADDETAAIRERFLYAIIQAATTDHTMGLDFVYGDIEDGVLRPLDGQQRLTTLFLLHWYVASRAISLNPSDAWLRFSYATRPTARDFSHSLAEHPYPADGTKPSEWITDQPWYIYPWRQDPTISSMLVMLDAIDDGLAGIEDFEVVWARLSRRSSELDSGAIWFLFLPVVDMEYGEDLYIKMNSRGRPLSPFEVFKADFEATIAGADKDRHKVLVDSMDGAWANTLWEYEKSTGGDYSIDDEFMRYLTFIIDVCEYRDGAPDRRWHDKGSGRMWPLEERARLAFADPMNPDATRNRDFFFHAFDTWTRKSPEVEFGALFSAGGVGNSALPLFGGSTPDLFGACITKYGVEREFSVTDTLMLFAVLLLRQAGETITPEQQSRRLRSLRNLTAAFIDSGRLVEYIAQTEELMLDGTLASHRGFRGEWMADEEIKWKTMDEHAGNPEVKSSIHELEDNLLVRGRIMAFDLDPEGIASRASAFAAVSETSLRDLFGAALLTKGDYSREVGWNGERRQLGSSQKDDSWMDMLTTGSRESLAISTPLMALLDDYAARDSAEPGDARAALESIRDDWLAQREASHRYDWVYYLARYSGARSSSGDGYFHNKGYDAAQGGFRYRRLRILHGGSYVAYFTDALLRAAWVEGSLAADVYEPSWWRQDDPGLKLKTSGIEIRCDDDGLEIVLPEGDDELAMAAASAIAPFKTSEDGLRVLVQQAPVEARPIDSEDRVLICVRLVKALVSAGL